MPICFVLIVRNPLANDNAHIFQWSSRKVWLLITFFAIHSPFVLPYFFRMEEKRGRDKPKSWSCLSARSFKHKGHIPKLYILQNHFAKNFAYIFAELFSPHVLLNTRCAFYREERGVAVLFMITVRVAEIRVCTGCSRKEVFINIFVYIFLKIDYDLKSNFDQKFEFKLSLGSA